MFQPRPSKARAKPDAGPEFVCPLCHGELAELPEGYRCEACRRDYPILHGIPDFRLRSDRYLSLEEEREKARRLAAQRCANYEELLDFYYEITHDVPPALAARYKAYNHNGPAFAEHGLCHLNPEREERLLDAGCGSGGALLAASARCDNLVGVDIALRWLVICKRRLADNGVSARLVCADVEALPFAAASFDQVLAGDLIENVHDTSRSIAALEAVMRPGAGLWVTGNNKYCLGPHATTRLWAIGFFPRPLRSAILRRLRGVDSLRFIHLLSARGLRALGNRVGLRIAHLGPKILPELVGTKYARADRRLIRIYRALCRMPISSWLLLCFGPSFEMLLRKPESPKR